MADLILVYAHTPSHTMYTTPCTECRRLRKRCMWPDTQDRRVKDHTTCVICEQRGRQCSGPAPLREGPCESCKRSKVRCVWKDGDRCKRCVEHGSDVCPMPPRKRLSRSPQDLDRQLVASTLTTIHAPSTKSDLSPYSPRSLKFSEITYLNSAIYALAHMKSIQLHMVGRPFQKRDTESQQALDAFCESLAELAGLMFTELQVPNLAPKETIHAATESSDGVTFGHPSNLAPTGTSSRQSALQIRAATRTTWSKLRLVPRDRKALPNRDWWLKFSSSLRLLRALRLTPDSEADLDLLRVCLTETGVQCLEYAAEPTSSEEETAGLRLVARNLMVEEANLSCALRKSSMFPDISASATLPSLVRIGSWDGLSLKVNSDTVKNILLPPATCCISRTAHALAANHYKSLEALLVALSELKIAHEHTRRLSEAMVGASDGPPSDPDSRDMARSVIKTALWALETWTNLLVRVKDIADGWSERSAWLAAQVSEVQEYVAEACDRLLFMFDRFSDLYQGCDTARSIIERQLQEFPEVCVLPGTAITDRLLHVFELSSFWNNKAIELPSGVAPYHGAVSDLALVGQ